MFVNRRSPKFLLKISFILMGLGAYSGAITPPARGSAFSIAELGARASGMGTAFTSIADDGSALFYNPAGIAFQPGTRFQMDNLVVVGLFHFFPLSPRLGTVVPEKGFNGSIRPKFIPVGTLYFSQQLSDRTTLGVGLFSPFGLSANFTNFNDSDPSLTKFTGRFAGTRARLESIWLQPTIAFRLTENSSIAVGGALVYTHLFLEQSFLNPQDDGLEFGREAADDIFPGVDKEQAARSIARLLPEGRSRVAGTSLSPGLAAGFLYKHPAGHFNFGLMYRSPVVHHLKGKASFAFNSGFTLEPFVGADLLPKAFPNQDIKGTFVTPASYALGISTRLGNTTLSADFHFQDFRRFRSVPLNFSQTEDTNEDVRTPAEERLNFDFRDSFQIAGGLEQQIGSSFAIRGGYLYDRSPVVEKSVGPLFPDANRHSATVGMSLRAGNKEFSLFYEAMQFVNRHTNVAGNDKLGTNGEYRNFAHLAGASLRFILGAP
ncbi:MAG: outer membrane protein transport protein [Acidobacteria bacterium]|nr:outer membrane protein transport protein [Acidobacteriota bacterium]